MLYQNVSKYGLATHLALAAALPAALAQFVSCDVLAGVMFWVSLAASIWILMEPSVFSGETISGARARVLHRVFRDPLAWLFLVVVVFAFVRWLNSGVRLAFDAEASVWAVKEAAATFLPASSGNEGLFPLALAISMGVVVIGVKHALGRNARLWFGIAAGVASATGACIAVIQAGMGVEPFHTSALASFGTPCLWGSMYAMFLLVTVACGIEAEGRGMTKSRLFFAWSVAGNGMGAYLFLPGLLSVAYLSLAALVAIVAIVLLKQRSGAAAAARATSMLAFGIIMATFATILPPYAEIQEAKVKGFAIETAFPPALADRNAALARISKAIWMDHPWSGVGIGAFKLHAPFSAGKDDWAVLPPQPTVGPNGYFTLVTERGIVDALLWCAVIAMLVYFWVFRFIGSFKWQRQQDEGRSWFLNISAVVWVGPLALLACLVDAWFSSNFPLTALAGCMMAALSLAAASFPKAKQDTDKKESEG